MTLLADIWTFLRSPIGRWIAAALVVVAMLFAVRAEGVKDGRQIELAVQAKALEAAQKQIAQLEAKAGKLSADARAKNDADNARIAALTAELQTKVSTYVTPKADRQCIVSRGYVSLRNAAGAGVSPPPAASGGSVDADSGVALSAVAENDVYNAGEFNRCVAEVKAWRGWYPKLVALLSPVSK
jgi:hypothetical protein